jgi:nicotinate-nucleotide adenylyltransferase
MDLIGVPLNGGAQKKTATGVLGGSFDPIHNGHIYLAEQARKSATLDRVILVPALAPPHKTTQVLTAPEHRLNMIRQAIAKYPWMSVDDLELRRGGISYTVDTVNAMAKAWPGSELYFIIGSDSLTELWTWRRIKEIAEAVTFLTLSRDGGEPADPGPELFARLEGTPLRSIPLAGPPMPVSSTMIRRRAEKGLPIQDLVPPPVADYIRKHGLYIMDG